MRCKGSVFANPVQTDFATLKPCGGCVLPLIRSWWWRLGPLQESEPGKMPRDTLTPRQRVLKAINHEPPDRVPIDLGGNQSGIHKFAYRAAGSPGHSRRGGHHGCGAAVGPALRGGAPAAPRRYPLYRRRAPADWKGGIVAEAPRRAAVARPDRRMGRHLVHARRSSLLYGHLPSPAGQGHLADLRGYPFPKGDDPSRFAGLRQRALQLRRRRPMPW